MNENIELIKNKNKNKKKRVVNRKNINLKFKIDKRFLKIRPTKKIWILFAIVSAIIIIFSLSFLGRYLLKRNNKDNIKHVFVNKKNRDIISISSINQSVPLKEIKFDIKQYKSENNNNDNNIEENNHECNSLDPINIFERRLKDFPKTICHSATSNHVCYKNDDSLFVAKNGVFCKMQNIVLDPLKWKDGGFIYKGPVDPSNRGCPILTKGFFNIKCEGEKKEIEGYDEIYNSYFAGWNYDYTEKEDLEELAPGKTIFFISRNQDSPNLYHGGSEFVNAVSMVYLLDLNPQDIQVVFLESIALNDDPFYDLYKNLISRGGEPIYIKNLKKKYLISSAIHVPINWDSPCFIYSSIPSCQFPTKTYKFYNYLIDNFMNIPNYEDSFKSDGEIFYYPKSVIESHNSNIEFTKIVTFQWRRVWPKGRKDQQRILGNGPELADKLASFLPKNILLRLIDTARLPISEQIAILRKTDYYVGIHGAGLCLSIFAPKNCIYHEVLPRSNMNGLLLMAALSGHKTYNDIIRAEIKRIDDNEVIFFMEEEFVHRVIDHMKENKIID